MKRNIIVLAFFMTSVGAFAQKLKGRVQNLQQVKTEAIKEDVERNSSTQLLDQATELAPAKTKNIPSKGVKSAVVPTKTKNIPSKGVKSAVVNLGTDAVVAVKEVVKVTVKELTVEKEEPLKETTETKIEEVLVTETEALKTSETDIAKLSAEVAGKEALKENKKAALLTKIKVFGAKISAAESKVEVLKKTGLDTEALLEKTTIIDGAKTQLAALTASYH
jgi:hypothetical protein